MANFIEFYHNIEKCINIDLIRKLYPPYEVNGTWEIGLAYSEIEEDTYKFKTQEEAQELYDKLRGKKKEESSALKKLKEDVEPNIRELELSLLVEDIKLLIELEDTNENTILKIKNLIEHKFKVLLENSAWI